MTEEMIKDHAFCQKYYAENADFKQYVDKLCVKEEKSVEEALWLKLVHVTAHYYKDAIKDKITDTKLNVGCGGADALSGECK